jgi:hypothetical protein
VYALPKDDLILSGENAQLMLSLVLPKWVLF